MFEDGSVDDLVSGIQVLLSAIQRHDPAEILGAMKSVVLTVRKHLDDAEEFNQANKTSLKPAQIQKLENVQGEISEKLTSLVVLAKGMYIPLACTFF